jgi:hypothetical protein
MPAGRGRRFNRPAGGQMNHLLATAGLRVLAGCNLSSSVHQSQLLRVGLVKSVGVDDRRAATERFSRLAVGFGVGLAWQENHLLPIAGPANESHTRLRGENLDRSLRASGGRLLLRVGTITLIRVVTHRRISQKKMESGADKPCNHDYGRGRGRASRGLRGVAGASVEGRHPGQRRRAKQRQRARQRQRSRQRQRQQPAVTDDRRSIIGGIINRLSTDHRAPGGRRTGDGRVTGGRRAGD